MPANPLILELAELADSNGLLAKALSVTGAQIVDLTKFRITDCFHKKRIIEIFRTLFQVDSWSNWILNGSSTLEKVKNVPKRNLAQPPLN